MNVNWTSEQVTFLECDDPIIRIRAFAGAAKTTSLVGYTRLRPQKRFLYLAFNKSVREEATERFPRHVEAKTTHALAFAAVGIKFKHKLAPNLRLTDVANAIDSRNWGFVKIVVETLNNFMASGDDCFNDDHLPAKSRDFIMGQNSAYLESIYTYAEFIWSKMIDPEDTEIPCLHDTYLKLFALSNPDLSKYDGILVDEAQDTNPVTLSIILQQKKHSQLIFCGDSHQQIYSFRGACDALEHPELAGSTDLNLTNSFRFGPAVAQIANILLSFKGETRKVTGAGYRTQIKPTLPEDATCPAYIHRTVMGVIDSALEHASKGKKIYWVGGLEAYSIGDLEDLHRLNSNEKDSVKNKRLLSDFSNFNQYMDMAEETHDPEMKRAVKIVQNYKNLSDKLRHLRKMTVKDESSADVIVTTAHRCKGLEWDYVQLMDDFMDPLDRMMDTDTRSDEINLLYVAATRAKKCLALNGVAIGMIREHTARTKSGLPIPTS
ncbi:3'-5' exonuclease [Pseudomonas aeruginosa]|uniref:3'-5' exonuclease n=1 Tax=Aquipseudomonas alcaligenes TaxID=43263 RepID=UPI001F0319F4|nr:3'-5' exonuclease [Pseudomonas alcaligenes]EKU6308789.1 ATP-dependent helicase [Pseudomonas aeruginosa]EKX2970367.1 ATP-dependent helicase [Pseudomonas aeruginosa]BDC78562.1 DNA helicase [Pseudomonas alcaligenes]HBO6962602.1 ATP-dependent helicase [Pseudomonas aeruginosa]HBO7218267.1 ATP-dependent helicase [Pseudomonas aeruginosa]